jgi:RNA recognition motif-containing protein
MNIFVAKLNFKTTSEQLLALFEQFGEVTSAKVIIDKLTNRSKGYGFVEMANETEAYAAINDLNESELDGSTIVVKKARPKTEGAEPGRFPRREGGGGGGYRGEGGSGGSGGGGGYRNRY